MCSLSSAFVLVMHLVSSRV
uniref:Uncharacterized protein n=1 Tax=Arundo donax TaxID=35708 RepID=A0A0A8Z502_ARUDO